MTTKKKKKKIIVPNWLKSKYLLFGAALFIAVIAVYGYRSSAHSILPQYPTSLSTCMNRTIDYGAGLGKTSGDDCVKYIQDRLNYHCKQGTHYPSINPFSWHRDYDLVVDGVYLGNTKEKLIGFKKVAGLNYYPNDTTNPYRTQVGPKTWARMQELVAARQADTQWCEY